MNTFKFNYWVDYESVLIRHIGPVTPELDITYHTHLSDPDLYDVACMAAKDFYDNSDGRYYKDWITHTRPIIIVLFDESGIELGTFEVEIEYEPEFYADDYVRVK